MVKRMFIRLNILSTNISPTSRQELENWSEFPSPFKDKIIDRDEPFISICLTGEIREMKIYPIYNQLKRNVLTILTEHYLVNRG